MGGNFPGWSFPDTAKIEAFMRELFTCKEDLEILMIVSLGMV